MKELFLPPSLFILTLMPVLQYDAMAQASPASSLLNHYYGVKNALVNSDAATAAQSAASFQSALNNIVSNSADAKSLQAFTNSFQETTTIIKNSKDLSKQREAFAKLSASMVNWVKTYKPSGKVYIDYCPMKKASWLSAEQTIKNPYYGSSMLTCGKVTETIQ